MAPRIAAYSAFLLSWLVFAVVAVASAIPRLRKATTSGAPRLPSTPVIVGSILQASALVAVTARLPDGPLNPGVAAEVAVTLVAPASAALFAIAMRHSPRDRTALTTTGPYSRVRHPIYTALFGMLLATGLLAGSAARLALGVVLYVAGAELRVRQEEQELRGAGYAAYKKHVRWRYVPGIF